jgi:MFS transporter, UMF1 family
MYPLHILNTNQSQVFYGASNVLANAFLPVFVRNHPDMATLSPSPQPVLSSAASTSTSSAPMNLTESSALLPSTGTQLNKFEEETEKANQIAAHISSRGLTFGYISALILQATVLGCIYYLGTDNPIALKFPIFLAATWWTVFFYPTVPFWLKPRPGPPLASSDRAGRVRKIARYIGFGWKQIWETIKEVGRLREVRIYLISWFLLSDGVITMSALAIIYAKTSLQLTPAGLALISATALIMNALGAWLWPSFFAKWLRFSVISMMKLLIVLMACLPGYAMLGMIWPGIVDSLGFGALTNAWELYSLAAVFGFVAGGVNVYGRAIYSELIPSGKESSFFSVLTFVSVLVVQRLTSVAVCDYG